MTARCTILVVQHEDACPPGWLGEQWEAAGCSLDVRTPYRTAEVGHDLPTDLSGHAALVVLGGEMGANDDQEFSWLTPTKALLRKAIRSGTPTLAVCLGHQLAAAALDGRAAPNPAGPASGVTPIALTDDGAADPLLGGLHGRPVVQWNDDVVVEMPSGATVLATAPDGSVQAARLGETAWGLQFHPEAGPQIFDRWTVAKPSATERARRAAADVRAREQDLRALNDVLAKRFLAVVRRHGADRVS